MNMENMIPVPGVTPESMDYRGEDDLLYCGICHEPKEAFFPEGQHFGGKDRHPSECACQRKRREAEEAEREAIRHARVVRDLREKCFPAKSMWEWTFDRATIRNENVIKALDYVARWESMERDNVGMTFWGSVGTGKSFLAGCIANALIEKEVSVKMTSFSEILDTEIAKRPEFVSRILNARLVILDDLGVERDTSYAIQVVTDFLDQRDKCKKPLIVTTNYTVEDMLYPKDLARARMFSRLRGMAPLMRFSGEDLRNLEMKRKQKILKDAFDHGEGCV